jgi:hypothetical protein
MRTQQAVTVGTNVAADVVSAVRSALARHDPVREYRRTLRRHERTVGRLRSLVFTGAVGAVATLIAAVAGKQPWWLVITAASCWVGGGALVRLRRARPPEPPPSPPAWLPDASAVAATLGRLPRLRPGTPGSVETDRLARAEANLHRILPAVAELHPSAAQELRRAAAKCGPVLHQQAGRIVVLTSVEVEMAGSEAATTAASAARDVAVRLGQGVDAYEQLLSAAVALLAAPDLARSPEATVGPAIDGMHAYAHGLTRARDVAAD